MTVKEDTVQQSHDEGMAVAVAVEAVSSVELSSQSMMPISTATMGVAASSAASSSSLGASINMVKVIAPATLPGGAVFEAYVDGIKFNATVPEGGIGEGDDFTVPYPTPPATIAEDPLMVAGGGADTKVATAFEVPTGHWRNGLYDCFDACCCPCLLGAFCFPILLGQIMQRMKMNFFGCANTDGGQPPICITYTIITLVFFVLGSILLSIGGRLGYIIWALWGWYMLIVFTCARITFRQRYNLPTTCYCGDSCLDDCCSVYWCSCCTAIQMARHTHDETKYPYDLASPIGLASNAPEIV